MHVFDYSFLKDMLVTSSFAKRLSRIESFRCNTRSFAEMYPDTARDMIRIAKIMSTRESNAIEGIGTEDSRLFGLLSGRVKPMGHDEMELLGYRDALERIHSGYDDFEITPESILDLYSTLMSHVDADPVFKTRNNEVIERDSSGAIVKRFKTVPAKQVDEAMFQLTGAYMEARDDASIDNMLLIPCFILDFLRIHPFMDGNGRMSRLLTTLLLYQEGYDVCAYVSLEALINKNKGDYYEALERSGEGWFDDMNNYMPFIEYFIGIMFMAYREMDMRMAACIGKDNKENRLERVLMNISIPISKREICMLMPDISETYVEMMLGKMVSSGKIERMGAKNSSRYLPRRGRRRSAQPQIGNNPSLGLIPYTSVSDPIHRRTPKRKEDSALSHPRSFRRSRSPA